MKKINELILFFWLSVVVSIVVFLIYFAETERRSQQEELKDLKEDFELINFGSGQEY